MSAIVLQLLMEFFGAFLGFLFAALLSGILEKHTEKKRYCVIRNNLVNELKDIVTPLKRYVDQRMLLSTRIATPTWDALQFSGMLLNLIETSYFDSLVHVYSLIKAYNEDRIYGMDISVDRLSEIVNLCEDTLAKIEMERK